jgi:DNA-binding response OmpR family regulator
MSEVKHIVVVDDEDDVRDTLRDYLGQQGFRVTALDGGAELRRLVEAQEAFDIAILDIAMPGEDGLSLARFLREQTRVGIIMLTASGEMVDRVVGYEMGADDYIPKPVVMRELLARIKAVLRRLETQREGGIPDDDERRVIAFGQCRLDMDAHRLYDEDGKVVPLTAMEFSLLEVFAERPNRVLSRNQLLELAHDRGDEPFDRSIDSRIARIRRKVERDPGKPQVIKTVRGTGYMYSPGTD